MVRSISKLLTPVCLLLAIAFLGSDSSAYAQSDKGKVEKLFKQVKKEKDAGQKIALLQQIIEIQPDFTDALYELGVLYRKDAQYLRAAKILERALASVDEQTPQARRFEIHYELAQCYSRTGEINRYEQSLRKAELYTNNDAIRSKLIFDLASLYFKQSRYEEALAELNRGIELEEKNRSFYDNLIILTRKNIQLEQAYRVAVEAKKNGNYAHALEIFDSIHKITPGFRNVSAQITELNKLLAAQSDSLAQVALTQPKQQAAEPSPDQAERLQQTEPRDSTADTVATILAEQMRPSETQGDEPVPEETSRPADSSFALTADADLSDLPQEFEIDEETVRKWQNAALIDSLLLAARAALDSSDAEAATELLNELIALAPDSRDVWLLQNRLTRKFPQQATVLKTDSLRMRATRYVTGFLMIFLPLAGFVALFPGPRAQYLIAMKKYEAAAGIYERMLEKQPERLELYPKLARLYLLTDKRHDFALNVFKTIVQLKLEIENRDKITTILTQAYLKEATPDSDAIQLLESLLKEEQGRKSREES